MGDPKKYWYDIILMKNHQQTPKSNKILMLLNIKFRIRYIEINRLFYSL